MRQVQSFFFVHHGQNRLSIRRNLFPEDRSLYVVNEKKVQVGKDQEKVQSEKDSHSKNQGGKKPN